MTKKNPDIIIISKRNILNNFYIQRYKFIHGLLNSNVPTNEEQRYNTRLKMFCQHFFKKFLKNYLFKSSSCFQDVLSATAPILYSIFNVMSTPFLKKIKKF